MTNTLSSGDHKIVTMDWPDDFQIVEGVSLRVVTYTWDDGIKTFDLFHIDDSLLNRHGSLLVEPTQEVLARAALGMEV